MGATSVIGARKTFKGARAIAMVALAALLISGCTPEPAATNSAAPSESAPASTAEGEFATDIAELGIDDLPESVREYYGHYETFSKLYPDPYKGWTPPAAPWKFCLNDSYLGNDWRQGNLAELERQVNLYVEAGLATGPLVTTSSDNEITMQISQFNNLVDEGCNIIISIPGSPTAMCQSFQNAFDKGVLVVTDESPSYCPHSLNVSWNGYWAEYVGGKAVIESLGGKGNIVNIAGIPGVPLAVAEQFAIEDLMKEFPDVKHLGTVAGDWTPATTKTEMTKFLATHPQQIDGIIEAGGEAVAAEEALLSAGRPLAVINSIDGPASFLAFWKEHPEIHAVALNQSPASAAYETFLVIARKLAGQDLNVNTIFYPVPTVTDENFNDYWRDTFTTESTGIPTPPEGYAVEDSYFDAFFSGGSPVQLMPVPPVPAK
ncbi:MAG: substrate-binding domain-containing protein [Propionibacteriaceae bacterium]|nr:substrate-binding domain-containing protein [Propionibacteriaceae bacterium]